MGALNLGKIALLVEQGRYSNRTDFICSAIRSQLDRHTLEVQQPITRHLYGVMGVYNIPADVPVALADREWLFGWAFARFSRASFLKSPQL